MSDIQPLQVYKRGHVVAVVLEKRAFAPHDWVWAVGQEHTLGALEWWDVLILDSNDSWQPPGRVKAWVSGMLTDEHSTRIA